MQFHADALHANEPGDPTRWCAQKNLLLDMLAMGVMRKKTTGHKHTLWMWNMLMHSLSLSNYYYAPRARAFATIGAHYLSGTVLSVRWRRVNACSGNYFGRACFSLPAWVKPIIVSSYPLGCFAIDQHCCCSEIKKRAL